MINNQDYKLLDYDLLKGENTPEIAQHLLGQLLYTHLNGETIISKIVETEAYQAPHDKASHAYGNKKTNRTRTMFGKAGTAYVYLCYGIHNMLNVVTGPEGKAHAILIRAVEPVSGLHFITKRRKSKKAELLTNGPGKLCSAHGITREQNGTNLLSPNSSIQLLTGNTIQKKQIIASERVGIAYAEECALWPWRFRLKDNKWTSLPHIVSYPDASK